MGENIRENFIRINIKEERFLEVYWEKEGKVIVNINNDKFIRKDDLKLKELIKILEKEKSKIR